MKQTYMILNILKLKKQSSYNNCFIFHLTYTLAWYKIVLGDEKMDNKYDLQVRLNKVAGQVNGIKKMIDNDRECMEVLIQIDAVDKALKSLGKIILKEHLSTHITKEIKKDNTEIIDEVMDLFDKVS